MINNNFDRTQKIKTTDLIAINGLYAKLIHDLQVYREDENFELDYRPGSYYDDVSKFAKFLYSEEDYIFIPSKLEGSIKKIQRTSKGVIKLEDIKKLDT